MKDLQVILIYMLAAFLLACLTSAFAWGIFSIINGSVNGKEWNSLSRLCFVGVSLFSLLTAVLFAGVVLEAKEKI